MLWNVSRSTQTNVEGAHALGGCGSESKTSWTCWRGERHKSKSSPTFLTYSQKTSGRVSLTPHNTLTILCSAQNKPCVFSWTRSCLHHWRIGSASADFRRRRFEN